MELKYCCICYYLGILTLNECQYYFQGELLEVRKPNPKSLLQIPNLKWSLET